MLITMLKGRKKTAIQAPLRPAGVRSTSSVMDVSGPLPERPGPRDTAPYREALVGAALRRTEWRRDRTEMSDLPREIDPFESDFPWIGWVEPRHESVVRSDRRSPTFEEDLQRVLRIFAN